MKRYLFAIVLASVMGITSTVMAASNFEKRQEITQKETLIRITAGEKVLFATLNDTQTARDFMATLPRTLPMKRLFDREYYAVLPKALSKEGKTQETYELGDVAFWTRGDYFGLLFSYERPKLSAPIIVMGRMTSDLAVFDTLGDGIDMLFEVENTTVRK